MGLRRGSERMMRVKKPSYDIFTVLGIGSVIEAASEA